MQYTVKQSKINNNWVVVEKNQALNYVVSTAFETKDDAVAYIADEKNRRSELLSNVVTISDYFKVGA